MLPTGIDPFTEYKVYQWLRANTLDYLSSPSAESERQLGLAAQGGWKERREAEEALEKYLADFPSRWHYRDAAQTIA